MISYKLNISVSFLGKCDQCALSMKARIIEFLRLDQNFTTKTQKCIDSIGKFKAAKTSILTLF